MKHQSYRITVLEPAARDVQTQFNYIHQRSPAGAESWYEAYLAALERVKLDPLRLSLAPENDHVEEVIRQVFFRTRRGNPYRVLYTIVDDEVRVLRVRGLGQDVMGRDELEH